MDVWTVIGYLLLGGILGAVGQIIRIVVGLKKKHDDAIETRMDFKELFDSSRLWTSLLIAFIVGAVAGILGTINFMGQEISKEFILAMIGIGYSGTDFIEGFIVKTDWQKMSEMLRQRADSLKQS
jgi:H+/Cl- antiporter ClcA